jgi:hypothetical protein
MLEQAQAQCAQLLTSRRWQLDALAQALLEREVLCGDELKRLLAGADGPLAPLGNQADPDRDPKLGAWPELDLARVA